MAPGWRPVLLLAFLGATPGVGSYFTSKMIFPGFGLYTSSPELVMEHTHGQSGAACSIIQGHDTGKALPMVVALEVSDNNRPVHAYFGMHMCGTMCGCCRMGERDFGRRGRCFRLGGYREANPHNSHDFTSFRSAQHMIRPTPAPAMPHRLSIMQIATEDAVNSLTTSTTMLIGRSSVQAHNPGERALRLPYCIASQVRTTSRRTTHAIPTCS